MHPSAARSILTHLQGSPELASSASRGAFGPVGLELRQVSGLTAGNALPFVAGGMQLSLDDATVGFRLDVDDVGDVVITPVGVPVRLDERLIVAPTVVGHSVIDVGSARFVLARRRPPTRRRRRPNPEPSSDKVSLPTSSPGAPAVRDLHRSAVPPPDHLVEVPVPDDFPLLVDRIHTARQNLLITTRAAHPDPEELLFQASERGPRLWTREASHHLFAHVPVAHADLPWRPRFDRPYRISTQTAEALRDIQVLPSAPLAADLTAGPLAIIGSRQAALAIARQALVSLATMSPPDQMEIAILAGEEHAADWGWADYLPHARPSGAGGFPILVIDGLDNLESLWHGLDDDEINRSAGVIALSDDVANIPQACQSVVLVNDDFSCSFIDHRTARTTMGATPLGLTQDLAIRAAIALRAAVITTAEDAATDDPTIESSSRESSANGGSPEATDVESDRRGDAGDSTASHYGYEYAFF
jgi:hypothetical protein